MPRNPVSADYDSVPVSVSFDRAVLAAIDAYAKQQGLTRSAAVRRAVAAFEPIAGLVISSGHIGKP